jgi:hypothetical protein
MFGTYTNSMGSSSGWLEEQEIIAPGFAAMEVEMEIVRNWDRLKEHIL